MVCCGVISCKIPEILVERWILFAFDMPYASILTNIFIILSSLIIICGWQQEIERALWDCASEGNGVVKKLYQLMEQVESIKSERKALEKEFKEAMLDISK